MCLLRKDCALLGVCVAGWLAGWVVCCRYIGPFHAGSHRNVSHSRAFRVLYYYYMWRDWCCSDSRLLNWKRQLALQTFALILTSPVQRWLGGGGWLVFVGRSFVLIPFLQFFISFKSHFTFFCLLLSLIMHILDIKLTIRGECLNN